MPLDPELKNAIQDAVEHHGQDQRLATRLLAWLTDASDSDLSNEDAEKHLLDVLAVIKAEGEL